MLIQKNKEICQSHKISQAQNSMIILITFQTHLLCVYLMCLYECILSDCHAMDIATSDWYLQQVNIKANELWRIAKTLFKTSNLNHSSGLIMKCKLKNVEEC